MENPKNLKAIANACDLMTNEQVKALGGTDERRPPKESTSAYGETQCQWATDAFTVSIAVNTTHGGLAKINDSAGTSDNFKPTQVDGYHGARVDEQSDLCAVELAVADDQSLEVSYAKNAGGTPEMDDSCGFAEKIATEGLKNIPGT